MACYAVFESTIDSVCEQLIREAGMSRRGFLSKLSGGITAAATGNLSGFANGLVGDEVAKIIGGVAGDLFADVSDEELMRTLNISGWIRFLRIA